MTIFIIDIVDDEPTIDGPWTAIAAPTHHATTNDGSIRAAVLSRGMSSGRASVALRAEIPSSQRSPRSTPPAVVVLELSAGNIEALAAAIRAVEARGAS